MAPIARVATHFCMKSPISVLLSACAALCVIIAAASPALSDPAQLHVEGNQLLDSTGHAVRLRGVNCASMEWSTNGEGHILKTVEVAVRDWHANIIRLPLSQDRWFGKAPDQHDGGASYRALVRQVVDLVSANNAYVILDLHWSDMGHWGRDIGQHRLPDRNSIVFWQHLAPAYANNPAVLFDLYNEPNHVTWDEWYKGGRLTETDRKSGDTVTYDAVGLPELFRTIRATGAKNVVVAGGINWAFEVGGILRGRELSDPQGHGVVYAVHPYPHRYDHLGLETIPQWSARLQAFADRLPLIVTEFGSLEKSWPFPPSWHTNDEGWNRETLRTLEAHHWNWVAWDMHPYAEPCLITGWNYTPTPSFGVWVKQALEKNLR